MRLREKVEAFIEEGVDRIFCLQFNRSLRSLSAREFIDQVLIAGLDIRCLVVGDDFSFLVMTAVAIIRCYGRLVLSMALMCWIPHTLEYQGETYQ